MNATALALDGAVGESEKRRRKRVTVAVQSVCRVWRKERTLRLLAETVEGLALSLQSVDNIQGSNSLSL
jgi:hypothetical protein